MRDERLIFIRKGIGQVSEETFEKACEDMIGIHSRVTGVTRVRCFAHWRETAGRCLPNIDAGPFHVSSFPCRFHVKNRT